MHRVLVVDDDADVRASLTDELGVRFHVQSAASGEEALLRLGEERFDALVSDVRMPGMGGVALLERARALDPELVRIFLTGYGDDEVFLAARASGAFKLRKPWGDELEVILCNALEHKAQLGRMRKELHGYLSVTQGAPNTVREVDGREILDHLRGSLGAMSWVKNVEIRSLSTSSDTLSNMHWFGLAGPSPVPGEPGLVEQKAVLGSPGGAHYEVIIRWAATDAYSQRVIDLALRQASDGLRMRELTDEVREKALQLESARLEVVQRDRLASLGAVAASVAHDLRTPLAALVANQQYLETELERHLEIPKHLADVFEDNRLALEAMDRILNSARSFASQAGEPEAVTVRDVVEITTRLLRWHLAKVSVSLSVDVQGDPVARVTPGELSQILINLIANAAQASPPGSTIQLVARSEYNEVVITVCDEGPGITSRDAERVFTPFHTTRSSGMGVGLSIARYMARRHGGELRLADREGPGALFELRLCGALEATTPAHA